jgi:hypothetical protein
MEIRFGCRYNGKFFTSLSKMFCWFAGKEDMLSTKIPLCHADKADFFLTNVSAIKKICGSKLIRV